MGIKCAGLYLMSCFVAGTLSAAVWTGTTDGKWETDTNWQANSQPAAGEAILFPAGTGRETITISSDKAVGNLTFVGANYVLQGGYALTLPADASLVVTNTATITCSVGGAATRLQKSGSGRLILSGNNTYTGKTTINDNGGNLRIETKASLGTGSVELWGLGNNSGTLELNTTGSNDFANAFINLQSRNSTVAHIKNMRGTNVLTANITLSNVNGFGLHFRSEGGQLIFKGRVANGRTDSRRLYMACTSGEMIFNEIATTGVGGGFYLAKEGAGAVTFAGPSTYTPSGVTTFNGGTIIVGTGGTSGSLGNTNLVIGASADKKLIFNRSDSVTFDYPITATSTNAIVKHGEGGLTLKDVQGVYDYSIEGGTLDLNGKTLTARNIEGAGTIQNATFTTDGTIEPNGTLNLPATTLTTGAKINIDFETDAGGMDDSLTFADSVDLSAVALTLRSADQRITTGRYTLVSVPLGKSITKPVSSVIGVPHTWACDVAGRLYEMFYIGGTVVRFQ